MRSFVLLAMVISLLIALRQIARQRLYYVMLRRGIMLDFETVSPINDPLFILLTVCLAISLSHCLVAAWQFHHDEKSFMDFMVFMNTILTRYLAHSCVFLAFLATAYDTEPWMITSELKKQDCLLGVRGKLQSIFFMCRSVFSLGTSKSTKEVCRS